MLQIGDIVWAKLRGHPYWPGLIADHWHYQTRPGHQFVYFFGTHNYAWVPEGHICNYAENRRFANKKYGRIFQDALFEGQAAWREKNFQKAQSSAEVKEAEVVEKEAEVVEQEAEVVEKEANVVEKFAPEIKLRECSVILERVKPNIVNTSSSFAINASSSSSHSCTSENVNISSYEDNQSNETESESDHEMELDGCYPQAFGSSSDATRNDGSPHFVEEEITVAVAAALSKKVKPNRSAIHHVPVYEKRPASSSSLEHSSPSSSCVASNAPSLYVGKLLTCSGSAERESDIIIEDYVKKKKRVQIVLGSDDENDDDDDDEQNTHTKASLDGISSNKNNSKEMKSAKSAISSSSILSRLSSSSSVTPATSKKIIGFIGIGVIGSELIKRLLDKDEFQIKFWNRSKTTSYGISDRGVPRCNDIYSLVKKCDWVFLCVSDLKALIKVIYGQEIHHGVVQALQKLNEEKVLNKGIVNMTTVGMEDSAKFEKAVSSYGGQYLEAQIIGSKEDAENGTLQIICAGEKSLYENCVPVFKYISKKHVFMHSETRVAPVVASLVSSFQTSVHFALTEAVHSAEHIGVKKADFFELLKQTDLNCEGMRKELRENKRRESVQKMSNDSNQSYDHTLRHLVDRTAAAVQMSNRFSVETRIASSILPLLQLANSQGLSEKNVGENVTDVISALLRGDEFIT